MLQTFQESLWHSPRLTNHRDADIKGIALTSLKYDHEDEDDGNDECDDDS